jgi:copper homeostasis protein CutC
MRPVTKEQWQDAVDAADLLARITTARVLLFLELARVFGLLDEDGEIDTQGCYEIIEDARSRGVTPSADAMRRFITD